MDPNTPTDANLAGAQPAADAEVQAAASGAQPAIDAQSAIDSLVANDPAALMAFLEGGYEAPPQTPQEIQTDPVPADGEQPGGDDDLPGDATPNKKPRARISLGGIEPETQTKIAVIAEMLRTGHAPDLASALRIIEGQHPQATPAAPAGKETPAAAPVEIPPDPELSEIEARIADLSAQRRQAHADYQTDEEMALTEQIEKLSREAIRAELRSEQRAIQIANYQAAARDTELVAKAKYPDLADESSAFSQLLYNKVLAAEAMNDPALEQPDFLIRFADQLAGMLGTAPQPAAANPKATQAPNRAARPVGSTLAPGHNRAVPAFSPESARDYIRNKASIEDLKAFAFDH